MEKFARLATSKGWFMFWFVWSVAFLALDIASGAVVGAVLMAVLAAFWGYQLYTVHKGTNIAHNRYHRKEV